MRSKVILLALAILAPIFSQAHEEGNQKKWKGSIAIAKKMASAELPALAKISLTEALQAALKASPGSAIKAEIEVENHSLIYSFDIVNSKKQVTEVIVDAGSGKILDVAQENDNDEKDSDDKD